MPESFRNPEPKELSKSSSAAHEPAEPLPLPSTGDLSRPIGESWDWQRLGACRGADQSIFYGRENEPNSERKARVNQAKTICAPCTVRATCLEFAIRTDELYGVWGGMTRAERARKATRSRWSA